jgi:hypothetical protein
MKHEGESSIWVLAVNGHEKPALVLGQSYPSAERATGALPQTQMDFEFSPLTVREIKPGEEYKPAPMSTEELH